MMGACVDPAETIKKFEAVLRHVNKNCRFFSTTMDNKERVKPRGENLGRGYAIPALWAHYAENHRGVCLVFDKTKLAMAVLAKCSAEKHQGFTNAVIYRDPPGYFTSEFDVDLSGNVNLEIEVLEHIVTHREAILFSKDLLWQYENEYRFVAISSENSEFEIDISGTLVGIFTSYNFPDCYKLNLLKIMKKFDVHALHVEWEFGMPYITQWPNRDGS